MAKAASGGHGVGITKNRVIRVGDDLWVAAKAKAAEDDTTLSEVIRDALIDYVGGDSRLRHLNSEE